ncbi:DUF3515 family protein [Cellulomonas palmilytica]|uniref:DUF3515 family protein n=1 Tax=Cellulomonas palmilytica TaxID=2608402 RepID=UPI001F2297CA|nr:DUF3515 family protein [Cellulomonas palmilytica]UJP39491.1 DUF3515 family protein [Cellulomonas palmilytica]
MPRAARRALTVALVPATLAGCASAVATTAGPYATDPVCAQVVLATPDELSDLERRDTDAQATTAWGDGSGAVVLRCGVEPLGPTTDRCETVESPDGTSVDWVVVASDPDDEAGTDWTFTTYGRVPAVQLLVPAAIARTHPTSFLDALGPAVQHTARERGCL